MIKVETFKAGHWEQSIGYKYFVPAKINDQWSWDSIEINQLLEKAAVKLGELNSYSKLVPSIDLFIQMHITKEAVISSRIEGTQTRIGEAILPEHEVQPERKNDWKEVNNYIIAITEAIQLLEDLPLSSRVFRRTHKILMSNVRGENKQPGEFRSSQNWIGGTNLSHAKFVPPQYHLVGDLIGDLENFLHNDKVPIPDLIRIGIAHYQFETIHPFLDGNGRIGRLLITLFLVNQKILEQPLLYLSLYFDSNKADYYDYLTFVRERNDMKSWLLFFLNGIEETASNAVDSLSKMIEMKTKIEQEITQNFKSRTNAGLQLLNELLKNPVTTINSVAQNQNVTFRTADSLVKEFISRGWLTEITGQSRNRIYLMQEYLRHFE